MTFVLAKEGGFVEGERLLDSELNTIQNQLVLAVDGGAGGEYSPSSAIVIGGSGLEVTGPFEAGATTITGQLDASGNCYLASTRVNGSLEVTSLFEAESVSTFHGNASFLGNLSVLKDGTGIVTLDVATTFIGGDATDYTLRVDTTGVTVQGSLSLGGPVIWPVHMATDANATVNPMTHAITYMADDVMSVKRTITLGTAVNGTIHTVVNRDPGIELDVLGDGTQVLRQSADRPFAATYLRVLNAWRLINFSWSDIS